MIEKKLIELLNKLEALMKSKGDFIRTGVYKRARENIVCHGSIQNIEELKNIKGVGKKIIEKFQEYEQTNTLKLFEREKNNPIFIFNNIFGVGPKKSKEIVQKHKINTIAELRKHPEILNDKQIIGLKYYEPLLKRIPRSEIDKYMEILSAVFASINDGLSSFKIVGSYRRLKLNSGDIDLIITNSKNDSTIFQKFIDILVQKKIVIELLSRGKTKSLAISKLNDALPRRMDFMFSSLDEFPFALLYFTGSGDFNVAMRQIALNKGYTMNEHGLYHVKHGKKTNKIQKKFTDEESIFDFLGLKYISPENRIDANSIVHKSKPSNYKTLKKKLSKSNKKTLKHKHSSKHMTSIEIFIKNGIKALKSFDENILSKILHTANVKYYGNGSPIMSDSQYDILKEYIEKYYPQINTKQGHSQTIVSSQEKTALPYYLGSLDKIKPDTNVLEKWKKKYPGPYIISGKCDGITGLYYHGKLFTRGTGTEGTDISHFIPYLKFPKNKNVVIRGELMIKEELFKRKYSEKFSNSRNFVTGLANRKNPDIEKIKDIDFVAYEVIEPKMSTLEQMGWLDKQDIITVINSSRQIIDNNILSVYLEKWRSGYQYNIDGIVVFNEGIYKRTNKNPKHGFAFKMVMSDQIVESSVVDVLWKPSKDGYLKPRVQIMPIKIGGVNIEYATAYHAGYVRDNKIGIGAVVQMIRSGDVIPKIHKVLKPASEPKLPFDEYDVKWNKTNVELILKNLTTNKIVIEKNIVVFFETLEVDSLGKGNVRKLVQNGYDTIPKILQMKVEDFVQIEGFKDKIANKIISSIQKQLAKADLPTIMAATNLFGRGMGKRRISTILKTHPNILKGDISDDEKTLLISNIKGFGEKTAQEFVPFISKFIQFIDSANLQSKLSQHNNHTTTHTKHPLTNKQIIMTGKRDKNLKKTLIQLGANITSSISKNTFAVIAHDKESSSDKINKAITMNIPLYNTDEFKKKFLK